MSVDPIWLARITWAGRDWWASTAPADTTIDGAQVTSAGALRVSYAERLPRLSLDGPELGASLDVDHDAADWAALRAAGHRWHTATGALYLLPTPDADPQPLLAGRIESVEYGDPDEAPGRLRCDLRAARVADTARLLPAAAALTVDRWPELADSALSSIAGRTPPLIIGRPGLIDGAPVQVAPAYPVEWSLGPVADRLILSGELLTESSVWLTDGSGDWRLCAVETVTDTLGRRWSSIDATTIATGALPHLERAIGTQWWWACSSATGPGSLALSSVRPGLGSVALAILQRSALPIDYERMAPAVDALDQIEVGAVVQDADASPLDVAQELLALAPCTLARSAVGLYLVPHQPPMDAAGCRHRWQDAIDVARVGGVEVELVRPPRQIEVRWGPSHSDGGAPTRRVILGPDAAALGLDLDPDGEAIAIEAPYIWDEASAWQVALLAAQARPQEREVVQVELPAAMHDVALGEWAALASLSLGRDLVGQVVARAWRDGGWLVTLAVDDLAR